MAIAHARNCAFGPNGTGFGGTFGFSTATTAGNFLVGIFRINGTPAANAVKDNVNGNWTQFAAGSNAANSVYIYYVANSLAGTLTLTLTNASSGPSAAMVDEFSGVATSSPTDVGTTGDSSASSTWTTGATTSVAAGELVYAGAVQFSNVLTVTAGSTNGVAMVIGGQTTNTGTIFSEYALSSAAGAQQASATFSHIASFNGCLGTFNALSVSTYPLGYNVGLIQAAQNAVYRM